MNPLAGFETPPAEYPAKLHLRTLATDSPPLAQLSWQPKTADVVWTKREWTSLCDHLHNGNPAMR